MRLKHDGRTDAVLQYSLKRIYQHLQNEKGLLSFVAHCYSTCRALFASLMSSIFILDLRTKDKSVSGMEIKSNHHT